MSPCFLLRGIFICAVARKGSFTTVYSLLQAFSTMPAAKNSGRQKSRPLWWNCLFTRGMSHIPAGIDKLHTAALEIIRFDRE